nr:MAG TPA: hypothetical protein [Caudoviricetes sp.]
MLIFWRIAPYKKNVKTCRVLYMYNVGNTVVAVFCYFLYIRCINLTIRLSGTILQNIK